MRNALTGAMFTAEELYKMAEEQQAKLATNFTGSLTWHVNAIESLLGQAAMLSRIEQEFSDIETWGREQQGWTTERVLTTKLSALAEMALADPDDTWSGRGNDARRARTDGAREILKDVLRQLRVEIDRIYEH